jgi:6-phosphofructokinase
MNIRNGHQTVVLVASPNCQAGNYPIVDEIIYGLPEFNVCYLPGGFGHTGGGWGKPIELYNAKTKVKTRKCIIPPDRTDTRRIDMDSVEYYKKFFGTDGYAGLIAIGGHNTLTNALQLKCGGIPVIGVPNAPNLDMEGTDYVVGFDGYVESWYQEGFQYIDKLKTDRLVGVLEIPNHDSSITTIAIGLALKACYICAPDVLIDLHEMADRVRYAHKHRGWALVIANQTVKSSKEDLANGKPEKMVWDEGKAGRTIGRMMKSMTGIATEYPRFGFFHRSKETARDTILGIRCGQKAAELVRAEQWWGLMVAIRGEKILSVPLDNFQSDQRLHQNSYWYELLVNRNSGKSQ